MPRSQSSISLQAPAPKAPAAAAAAPTALPALPHPGEPPAQSPPPAGLSDGRPSLLSLTLASGSSSSLLSAGREPGRSRTDYLISRNLLLWLANSKMMMLMLKPFHASEFFFIVCLSSLFSLLSPFFPPFCFLFSSSSSSQGLLCSCWGVGHGGVCGGTHDGHMPGVFQSGIVSRSCGLRWLRRHQGRWKELELGQGKGPRGDVPLQPVATRTLSTKQHCCVDNPKSRWGALPLSSRGLCCRRPCGCRAGELPRFPSGSVVVRSRYVLP